MNPSRFPAAFPFQQMLELHHQQQQQQQQQPKQEIPPHHHHHHQQQLSEEEDNSSSGNKELEHPHHHHHHQHQLQLQQQQQQQLQLQQSPQKSPGGGGGGSGGGGGGSGGEVVAPVRKPRGRPPGSKNKPKPPIIITRDTGTGMRPHILEVAPNTDIVDAIATFARKRQRAVCVLSAKGSVSNLTLLRHPAAAPPPSSPPSSSGASTSSRSRGGGASGVAAASAPPATVSFQGRFELISLSGAFLQQMPGQGITSAAGGYSGLAVSVAGGPQGQVLGGNVAGPLVSASPVMIIAASFVGPSFDRLPLDEHDGENPEEQQQQQQQQQQHQAAQPAANPGASNSGQLAAAAQHGNSTSPPSIPIHQLMNDPFGMAAAAAAAHHHGHHHQIPPPELLASWAAAAAAGATRPPM